MSDHHERFVRHAGLIAGLTALSRLLGLARDAICASAFGAGAVWDAFVFAFRAPNLLRRLLGEGALTAAFVPELSREMETGSAEEAQAVAGRVAGAATAVLIGLVLLGEALVLGARSLSSPGSSWWLALTLTAVLLPYAVFICLTALAGAVLNVLGHFTAPAAAPLVLNVAWILAVAAVAPAITQDRQGQAFVLAGAVLLAGGVQLWSQLMALKANRFRCRLVFGPPGPDVARVARAMLPVALGLAAFQVNVLLDGAIAIWLAGPRGAPVFTLARLVARYPMEVGANSVLYYANRLVQLPLGVFGIALATAAFPLLSRQASRRDWPGFSASLSQALGFVVFIGLPASTGLFLIRSSLVELLFERGAFTSGMTVRTATALGCYSAGIWAYCALHVLTRALYALGRHSVPAIVAGVTVGVNLALNLILVWPFGEAGLAASTSLCAAVQAVFLAAFLNRLGLLAARSDIMLSTGKAMCSTVLMAVAVLLASRLVPAAGPTLFVRAARVFVPTTAGVAAYLASATVLRAREVRVLASALRSPLRRDRGAVQG
jgi:putative peptidoglycan lipid II flippase